jgi:sugar lactone lactonase YvrE
MVYRFDPDTGDVRVVANGFIRSNGIAFTDDGKTAYMWVVLDFRAHTPRLIVAEVNRRLEEGF